MTENISQFALDNAKKMIASFFFSEKIAGVMLVHDTLCDAALQLIFTLSKESKISILEALYSLFDESFSLSQALTLLIESPESFQDTWQHHLSKKLSTYNLSPSLPFAVRIVGDKVSGVISHELGAFADTVGGTLLTTGFNTSNRQGVFSEEIKNAPWADELSAQTTHLLEQYAYWDTHLHAIFAEKPDVLENENIDEKIQNIIKFMIPLATETSFVLKMPYLKEWGHSGIGTFNESVKHILSPLLSEYAKAYQLDFATKVLFGNHKLREYLDDFLGIDSDEPREGFYQGVEDQDKQKIIFEGDFDLMIASSLMFANGSEHTMSFDECIGSVEDMDFSEKEEFFVLAFGQRKPLDPLPYVLEHGTLMTELLVDYETYIELSNLQIGRVTAAGMHTVLGYDYPEYFDLPELKKFREAYDECLTQSTMLAVQVSGDQSHLLPYFSCYGHVLRVAVEWTPREYVMALEEIFRKPHSKNLRNLMKANFRESKKLAPLFTRFIRIP